MAQSGGIESGLDAFERIKAGASVVEVYTSMVGRTQVCSNTYLPRDSRVLPQDTGLSVHVCFQRMFAVLHRSTEAL